MSVHHYVLILLVGLISVIVSYIWNGCLLQPASVDTADRPNAQSPTCAYGKASFILPGMKSCHPLLDCRQIRENVTIKDTFGQGAVKLVIYPPAV